jgi:gliding motility-associated-like protein
MTRTFLFVALALTLRARSQNLVPNGDFEQYSLCPDYVSQIDRAVGWSRPTEGTSDYFNACLGVPFSLNVPDNEFGNEQARSGNGYAGFYCFHEPTAFTTPGDDDHEYVTHELAAPLVPGRTYAVEFFVSLADASKYAVNEIGALLSVAVPHRTDELPIQHAPQITHDTGTWLDEKNGWTRVAGCIVADSAYRHITIGNFRNGAATACLQMPTPFPLTWYSYYYVDDVSLRPLEPPQLGPDIIACEEARIEVIDPETDAEYQWSTGQSGPAITVTSPGTYTVARTDLACPLSDTVLVTIADSLVIQLASDTTADLCASALALSVGQLPPGSSVLWSTGEATASILVQSAGPYEAHVESPGFCPATSRIEVHDNCDADLYAPAAFTPNDDGINDTWRPIWSAHPLARLNFIVFDRWGREVHRGTRGDGWGGTISGEQAPSGIYAYRLEAHDPTRGRAIQRAGSIALLR